MNYKVVCHPLDNSGLTQSVVDTDGKQYQTIIAGVVTPTNAANVKLFVANAAAATNNNVVALYVTNMPSQASTAQKNALLVYLAAIVAGTNTSAVETAINAL